MCIGGMRAWLLQNIGGGYCSASGVCGMHYWKQVGALILTKLKFEIKITRGHNFTLPGVRDFSFFIVCTC